MGNMFISLQYMIALNCAHWIFLFSSSRRKNNYSFLCSIQPISITLAPFFLPFLPQPTLLSPSDD